MAKLVPESLIKTLVDELQQMVTTKIIIGEPLTIGSHTIIPVCRVMVGFGAGGGEGESAGGSEKAAAGGTGGGGGGGLKIEPAAFIVEKDGELSVLAAPDKQSKLGGLLDKIPDIIEKAQEAKKGKEKSEESDA